MLRYLFTLFFFLALFQSRAQTFTRWAEVVGWDGVSHWKRYLIHQPAFLGPNALPVPKLGNGRIDSSFFIGVTGNLHYSPGDKTQNLMVYANYCLVKDLISFDLAWMPYEKYQLNVATKEKRHVFSQFYFDKEAAGEVHLNTNIQVLNKWRKHIGLALQVGYRFPSGSGFGAARFTDAPGYYFNLSAGKTLGKKGLQWNTMLGFYTWSIDVEGHNQNDAFLFGTGLEWNRKNWRLQTNIAGYLGYLENSGDKPVVYRFQAEKRLKKTSLLLGFQQGLHDFKYSSFEFGGKWFLGK